MHNGIRQKEEIFGVISATLAERVPSEYKPLIFASPISTRDPGNGKTWHYSYIGLPWWSKFIGLSFQLIYAALIGIVKITVGWGAYYKIHLNKQHDILIVTTNEIVSQSADKSIQTSYLNITDESEIDWLIIRYGTKDSLFDFRKFSCSKTKSLQINYFILKGAIETLVHLYRLKIKKTMLLEGLLLLIIWVFRQDWLSIFMIGKIFESMFKQYKYKIVFSPHEMDHYSRTVWFLAKKYKLKSVTLQHAVIYRNKLLFFPTSAERTAGLETPDIFFIYSQTYSALLKPYLPDTQFIVGASPRFGHWRNLEKKYLSRDNDRHVLVVSSMCWFDINTMLSCICKLLGNSKIKERICIRLHPDAKYTLGDSLKMKFLRRNRLIRFSNQSLEQDLKNSWAVLGCGSSVIFEALLLGIPTVIVQDDKFCNFDPSSVFRNNVGANIDNISWKLIKETAMRSNISELQKESADLLGIDKQIVTTLVINQLHNNNEARIAWTK